MQIFQASRSQIKTLGVGLMRQDVLSNGRPERVLLVVSLMLGLLHFWMGRNAMNVDGMSYLDVGDAFFHHNWAVAINGWWSPLYPWVVGTVLGIAKPSPSAEFVLVQFINFAVFVLTLFAFRFLLHSLLRFVRARKPDGLPDWALTIIAYASFLWIALEVETVYDVSPDLAVLACYCLSMGMLLRLELNPTSGHFAIFGFILALGYWVKTFLFPYGIATIAVAYLWKHSTRHWGRKIAVSALVFLCGAAPLIFYLSHEKGRLTFGDSGSVNFAWAMSPSIPTRNYQGGTARNSLLSHPTRQLLVHPPLFEFDGPVVGTYPPWTDPSYWNEGLKAHFRLRQEISVLSTTVPSEIRLLLRDRPDLVAGLIVLVLLSGAAWLARLRELWPLVVLPIVALGAYASVIENDRYLGGFVLVLYLALFAAVGVRPDLRRSAQYVAIAVFITMMIGTVDYTVRIARHHMAIPGVGPNSTSIDVTVAQRLAETGAAPNSKLAIIGDGTGAYWARLAKLRIVAEIMDMGHGTKEFWNSPADVQQQVYAAFRESHATFVVAVCPSSSQSVAPEGWNLIRGTEYCIRRLDQDSATLGTKKR